MERSRLVTLLRRLDMPPARIAEVLEADGPEAAQRLGVYWADVETRVTGQRALAAYLRGQLSGRSPEMDGEFPVETVDVPEQVLITETRRTPVPELPAWIGASLNRLEEAAGACGGGAGAPFVVHHAEVTMESDGPAECCLPVADEAAARVWAGEGGRARAWRTGVRVEPARRLAYTRITRAQVAFPRILAAFEAVERWIAAQGLEQAGPPREVYFADWDAAGPDDPVCDVAFPVR